MGKISPTQKEYYAAKLRGKVQIVDVLKQIPLPANSCDVVYSSHVIEHFDRQDLPRLLSNIFKTLRPGGVIRLVTPDLKALCQEYSENGDGDLLISRTGLAISKPQGLKEKIKYWINGYKHHRWLYDETSLTKLLQAAGFVRITVLPPGKTTIPAPDKLNLFEKEGLSLYIEAAKP